MLEEFCWEAIIIVELLVASWVSCLVGACIP